MVDVSLTRAPLVWWRSVQYLALLGGVVSVAILVYRPTLGLDILWNGLIPLAPALVTIAPGLWRNICPMATFSLLPRRFGISQQKSLPQPLAAVLMMIGLIALFLIVPSRHLWLNTNGLATAVMLLTAALLAFVLGLLYDWRSGWCNGLCPIHPVEKLYGQSPAATFANTRCDECHRCSIPCPDSTRSMQPLVTGTSALAKAAGHIITGSFVGFIWGWYRSPDYSGLLTPHEIVMTFVWPIGAGLVSFTVYAAVYLGYCKNAAHRRLLARVFATAALITYYWYRIPALAGFGPNPGSGMLLDLSDNGPILPWVSHTVTSSFFVWFLLLRKDAGISWTRRPLRNGSGS